MLSEDQRSSAEKLRYDLLFFGLLILSLVMVLLLRFLGTLMYHFFVLFFI